MADMREAVTELRKFVAAKQLEIDAENIRGLTTLAAAHKQRRDDQESGESR